MRCASDRDLGLIFIRQDLEQDQVMKKVLIIGCGGAGKSTLARRLGAQLEIPVIHLDREFWRAGWHTTPGDEWIERVRDLLRGDSWILDGNFHNSLPIRLAEADTVIYLDFPRHICLWRLLKRRIQYRNSNRPDMTEGCSERLNLSFLRWVWNFKREVDPKMRKILDANGAGKKIVTLKNSKQVERFFQLSVTP